MFALQELRKRAKGLDSTDCYNSVLSNFHCVHKDSPPSDETNETGSPLLSCAFARRSSYGHVLGATCDNGQIMILNTEFLQNDHYPYHIQQVGSDALFSVSWSDIDMKLITTSGNHNATLFDVHDDGSLTELNTFKAHTCTVKTSCFEPTSSHIFATGGRDGNIYIWDARSSRATANGEILPDNCILNSHCRNANVKNSAQKQKAAPSITCVTYQDQHTLISCADKDSCIKVWDLRKTYQYMKNIVPVQELICPDKKSSFGYSHMTINRTGSRLFASCTNSTIYCYNITKKECSLEYTYTGHECSGFYVKCSLSPDEKYLASTDSLNKVYIWKVNASKDPIVMLDGIHDGLCDVSWCPADQLKIATTSDYPRPWIWSALPESWCAPERLKTSSTSNSSRSWIWNAEPEHRSDSNQRSDGFAIHLDEQLTPERYRRSFTMASKLRKFPNDETELSRIVLPNAFVDGTYQTHTCAKIGPKPSSLNNWLTNLHIQQPKESISPKSLSKLSSPKSLSKLSVRNRVSPKVKKSPGVQNRSKSLKRKRLNMTADGNNLTKYFKHSDENFHNDQ
ncbi:denticleless protein homolog isoform X2 [Planococcus citri]|uniref:denticleless protein homolog isoform X2 n=1 Tax=Planococcus citri TaxID=170843 RepID=UPI0031F90D68